MNVNGSRTAEDTADELKSLLEKETEVLHGGIAKAEAVREYIFRHDWESLNESLADLDSSSAEVEDIEQRRGEVFEQLRSALDIKSDAGFYTVIVLLDTQRKDSLSELYRSMKTEVMKFQSITWSIDAYVRSMSDTIYDILHTAFPHKRGNMYEKTGRKRAVGSDPLVVNRRL